MLEIFGYAMGILLLKFLISLIPMAIILLKDEEEGVPNERN